MSDFFNPVGSSGAWGGARPPAAPATDSVRFEDAHDLADVETFLTRAKTADPDGAVRMWAREITLSLTVCLVPGAGLFGAGGVLGLRAIRVAEPLPQVLDVVVSVESVLDRIARMKRTGELRLQLPPVQVVAPWAGHAAPRAGWEVLGEVELSTVRTVADAGIAEITVGAGGPGGTAGALAVEDLRRRVWTRPSPDLGGAPAGLAFGAHVLGFLNAPRGPLAGPVTTSENPPEQARGTLYHIGSWWRLGTRSGHVIAR